MLSDTMTFFQSVHCAYGDFDGFYVEIFITFNWIYSGTRLKYSSSMLTQFVSCLFVMEDFRNSLLEFVGVHTDTMSQEDLYSFLCFQKDKNLVFRNNGFFFSFRKLFLCVTYI